jgi:uncharacterized protein YukE
VRSVTDINAALVDGIIDILEKFGVHFSGRGSDPDAIREQAAEYRQHAESLRQLYDQTGASLATLDWSGPAADAHSQLLQQHVRLAAGTADHLDQTAEHLDQHAGKAERIVRVIVGIALEILEVYLATLALSYVVGWLAQALFWVRAAWLIVRAVELCQQFRQLVASVVEAMRGLGSTAGKIGTYLGEILTDWLPAYVADTGSFYVGMMTPEFLSGKGLSNAGSTLVHSLLPFTCLDFAGYFGMHLLEQETQIGARVKNFIDGYGAPRRESEPQAVAADAPQLPPLEFEPFTTPWSEARAAEPKETQPSTPASTAEEAKEAKEAAEYVPETKAQVLYGAAKEFLVTAAGNTILNAANGDTKPADMLWGAFGGGAFASADKGVRQGLLLPHAMSKRPDGISPDLWMSTVGAVVKTGLRGARFTVKAPFSDLVAGSDIDTQLGSIST